MIYKTLHLTLEYPPQIGGIASYVYNFAAHTLAEETIVYAPEIKGSASFDAANAWKVFRHKPYWLLWPHWLRMLWQVYRIVKKETIATIYVHQVLPGGHVARIIKKLFKVPYIVFLHGTDLDHALAFPRKRKHLIKIVSEAHSVVVNSSFLAEKFTKAIFLPTPVRVLNPAPADYFFETVDSEKIKKLKSQLALQGKKVLLSVGRMVPGKGYATLTRLLPRLLEKFPDLVWICIGDGPEKARIVEMATKTNVQHVIRFLGSVDQLELPVFYQLADLFVLLAGSDSTTEEGWGTVFMEAAASGLAVVAGGVGGVPEAVLDKVTGRVVPPTNEEAMLAAISDLLLDPAQATSLGQAAKTRAQNEYTWQKQLLKFSRSL